MGAAQVHVDLCQVLQLVLDLRIAAWLSARRTIPGFRRVPV